MEPVTDKDGVVDLDTKIYYHYVYTSLTPGIYFEVDMERTEYFHNMTYEILMLVWKTIIFITE